MLTKICRLHGKDDLRIEEQNIASLSPTDVLISMARGGICGSDLHYFHDGGFGPIRVQEPIILGHEIAGVVTELGSGVATLDVGDRVAVNPSQHCSTCQYCLEGNEQHCEHMRFLGSARTVPHVQGGFREHMVIDQQQCYQVATDVSLSDAACAEPLAVCLHAHNQAGDVTGKRVLITGAGPIGSLCALLANKAKAIVVTDLHDFTLSIAKDMGATQTINLAQNPEHLNNEVVQNGAFDVVFECSAAQAAIEAAINTLKPRGTLVQVGVTGNVSLPINAIVGKEINLKGTHRFNREFGEAIALINSGTLNIKPLVTQTYPVDDALNAFKVAGDRSMAVKVHLEFGA